MTNGWDEWRTEMREALGLDKPDEKRDGGGPCVNCGLCWFNEKAECGHWFCDICLGRGRDETCQRCADATEVTP